MLASRDVPVLVGQLSFVTLCVPWSLYGNDNTKNVANGITRTPPPLRMYAIRRANLHCLHSLQTMTRLPPKHLYLNMLCLAMMVGLGLAKSVVEDELQSFSNLFAIEKVEPSIFAVLFFVASLLFLHIISLHKWLAIALLISAGVYKGDELLQSRPGWDIVAWALARWESLFPASGENMSRHSDKQESPGLLEAVTESFSGSLESIEEEEEEEQMEEEEEEEEEEEKHEQEKQQQN